MGKYININIKIINDINNINNLKVKCFIYQIKIK